MNAAWIQPLIRLSLALGLLSATFAFPAAACMQPPTGDQQQAETTTPATATTPEAPVDILRPENLVAWCIVPFDARQRAPLARAKMLADLGIQRCAYDWRAQHVESFEQEILAYQKHGIEFFAFWGIHERAFELFEQYDLHPQIWLMLPQPAGATQAEKVDAAVTQLLPMVQRTQKMQCGLGIYNHGGWSGEPENMAAVCRVLHDRGYEHVGIVYNFHHGHGHIDRWNQALQVMLPYLLCVNLNGMNPQADPKILGIGKGQHERKMIRSVVQIGYQGPIGILDHQPELDARVALQENQQGLAKIRQELNVARADAPPEDDAADVPGDRSRPAATETQDPPDTGTDQARPEHDSAMKARQPVSDPARAELVRQLAEEALAEGDPLRGARLFADANRACISCHQVGQQGGAVGPELTAVATKRSLEAMIASVLWPNQDVEPQYRVRRVLTVDGEIVKGFVHARTDNRLTLKAASSGELHQLALEDIEFEEEAPSVMPAELVSGLPRHQQLDLFRFLAELGREPTGLSDELSQALAHANAHQPADFPRTSSPLAAANWPNADHPVNRDRVYDFYTKQAEYFRAQTTVPMLLQPFPGLDGGNQGHWGNQNESTWRDGRWNQTMLGSVQAGVLRGPGLQVPRAICVRLGPQGELSACFNPDTLTYEAIWRNGFVRFDDVRHGFLGGMKVAGDLLETPAANPPKAPAQFLGFYRHGQTVLFHYRIGGVEYLDAPGVENGKFTRTVAAIEDHPLRDLIEGGPRQWPQEITTTIRPGRTAPYAIDTIELPWDNPWNALLYCGGHDFLPDGSALVCTMQGDVWRVTGLDSGTETPGTARWSRYASGLHHALGLVVHQGQVYVQCRDQLMRLQDLNGDGEADYYECFNNTFQTSAAGHDFICGLQVDAEGNFYTASGNEGLLQIASDGQLHRVLATGFRNPDGLAVTSEGWVTVPVSEGGWTPASAINAFPIQPAAARNALANAAAASPETPRYFGFGGPRNGEPPELPIVYLPRGLDNSSGGQVEVAGDAFGPLKGQLLHLSFGAGTWFLVLQDEVDGTRQAAVVPMVGDFASGVHRGRFRSQDGQLYVSGMTGWGSYTPEDGCFQRVRYRGEPYQTPLDFHVHENGILLRFALPVDPALAADPGQHFAQCWNYRYSGAYGSPEYSPMHPGVAGHDPLRITQAHVLPDGRHLFLEIPDLQPVSQLHLRLHVNDSRVPVSNPVGRGHDLFLTVHQLDAPFEDFPGYRARDKRIAAHPLLTDLAVNAARVENRWLKPIPSARQITIATAKNLSYATDRFEVRAGEPIAFRLENPDVVPHNWVLVATGQLESVGKRSNAFISDPTAFARQYIPDSEHVLAHTDIVQAGSQQTIYFHAPEEPGRYPFLCTFPGHWMVMNGIMEVKAAASDQQ